MKKLLITILFITLLTNAFGQISMEDSTVKVIAYWELHENQTYVISNDKLKIQAGDTISRDFTQYEVDITVLDSTENEYLLNWYYHDYQVESDNEMIMKLSSIIQNLNIQIKTDELGTFIEVVNWEDIRDYILKGTSMLKHELKDIPNMDEVVNIYENIYGSKEAIEAGAINEIIQLYYFHGLNYKLWEEQNYETQLPNMYGGEPFDAILDFWLDEINYEENFATFRMQQSVDSMQLTNATYRYLVNLAETMQVPPPSRDDLPVLHHDTWLVSLIHGSGWPLYSVQTKEVTTLDIIQSEECKIYLK